MTIFYEENISHFFEIITNIPNCSEFSKAYIVDTYIKYISNTRKDLSKDNIAILYCNAIQTNNFEKLQTLADWILFIKSVFFKSFVNESENYYNNLAKNSYYRCYLILNKKWLIYEELSNQFEYFTSYLKQSFYKLNNTPTFTRKGLL